MDEKIKSQQGGGLRSKLLEIASEIISGEGIKKLTMRALSHQAGVSRTAPYRHFKNKDALLLAIAEEGFNALTIRYKEINRNKSMDALSRLQNIGLAYIEFAVKNPGAFKLMFGPEITLHPRPAELSATARETFNEYLIAVKAFQDEKDMTTGDYSILTNYSWAAVHGLATLLIDGQIQISGKNHGLPTLLTDGNPGTKGRAQAMIAFSEQTLMNFWDLVLNGLPRKDPPDTL